MAPVPPSVPEVYRSYKKSTSAIVKWLTSCTGASPEAPSLSLKDMIAAAETIRESQTEIPPAIYWAFRDTIQNRSILTDFYKSGESQRPPDNASDTSHEHFTSTLRRISNTLFSNSKSRTALERENHIKEHLAVNSYGVLDIEELEDSTDGDEELRYGPRPMGPHLEDCFRNLGLLDEDGQCRSISGDVFKKYFDVIEFYDYMVVFDDTFAAVHRYWKQCDSSPLQLVITAWLTNIAYEKIKSLGSWARYYFAIRNHEQFLRRRATWLASNDRTELGLVDYDGACRETFRDGSGFIDASDALKTFMHTIGHASQDQKNPKFEDPRVMIPHPGSQNGNLAASTCMFSLLRSIRELTGVHKPGEHLSKDWEEYMNGVIELDLCPEGFNNWIYKLFPGQFNPLQTDIRDYLTKSRTNGTTVVFGIELWLKTFSTYISNEHAGPPPVDCRIVALRFAKEVLKSMRALMAQGFCEHKTTIGDLTDALNAYISDNRFDLYYRSPWVAGTHISQILGEAFEKGLPMVVHVGTVCAVLHLYNMFIQLGLVDAKDFQLLELLCSSLDDITFLGERPRDNFVDHLRRGVTLGKVTEQPSSHDKRWLLTSQIPWYSDHEVHSMSDQYSSFLDIVQEKYRVTKAVKCHFYGEGTSSKCEKRARERWRTEMSDAPDVHQMESPSRTLEYLHGLVEAEFYYGDFPMLRTNWFSVYLLCKKTLERMCELGIPIKFWMGCNMHGLACPDGGRLAVHLVADIAELVDRRKEGRSVPTRQSGPLEGIGEIQVARQALMDCTKGLNPSDFQWNL
ncbi:hypothetical protein BU16DRAFT_580821 [Lophium mytilinum]|uniref:DUF6604 domain-containing protein n=1 Tax=Lophium mytilinum TaxID=390894 RepID=A0A6A6QWB1_9PEZI|nr:hypothetical protein BU16DRAFT_580821 [Lophium mytilinum]